MSWRFQPVWIDDKDTGDRCFLLCEVFFRVDGSLDHWSDEPLLYASGETQAELGLDLIRMYVDAMCWKPVAFAELKAGMAFEALISMEEREQFAQSFERMGLPAPISNVN